MLRLDLLKRRLAKSRRGFFFAPLDLVDNSPKYNM